MLRSNPGPATRWLALLFVVAIGFFFLAMAAWSTERSFLDCTRTDGDNVACVVRAEYPGSIVFEEKIPTLRHTSVVAVQASGRGASGFSDVLVLNPGDEDNVELHGIGARGELAGTVQLGLEAFLRSGQPVSPHFPLRTPSSGSVVFLALSGLFFLSLSGFFIAMELKSA